MADYPYIQSADRLRRFMNHLKTAGVPGKITQAYLTQVGFKSRNDRPLVTIMKFIGFADSSGTPTSRWKQFRDQSKAGAVLAEGVREGYADIFEVYPDAHRQSDTNVKNFFSANTTVGQAALSHISKTFRTLCDLADFDDLPDPGVSTPSSSTTPTVVSRSTSAAGASVTINIRLEIPPTDDPTVYEAFFKSMKKHLLDSE